MTMPPVEDDQIKPWTIKNVPQNVRDRAIAAAGNSDGRIGDYVAQALREKLKNDRRPKVPKVFDFTNNLEAIKQMLELAAQLSKLNGDEPPPPELTDLIHSLMFKRVRAIARLGHTRMPIGLPANEDGPTIEGKRAIEGPQQVGDR
jgi:hypothetical protein